MGIIMGSSRALFNPHPQSKTSPGERRGVSPPVKDETGTGGLTPRRSPEGWGDPVIRSVS